MNSITLEPTAVTLYFVACNPLLDTFHSGNVLVGSQVSSGQPFMVHGTDNQTVFDMVYSFYDLDNESDAVPITLPFAWSVYFNETDINEVVATANNFDFLTVNHIKHPTENKWAIPVNDAVFAAMPAGVDKDFLITKATASIAEGRRFDTATMITDGWA